jgi:hypothetical protein
VVNRYVGNLPPMPDDFPDYPVIRNTDNATELMTVVNTTRCPADNIRPSEESLQS